MPFLASSMLMPFMVAHVPLATYFHSPLSMSTLACPAHECVYQPSWRSQFWPVWQRQNIFLFQPCAAAWLAAMAEVDSNMVESKAVAADAISARWFMGIS